MGLISKVATALRGAGRETMEGVVDANGFRILEQEIYEYEQSLAGARRDLTRLVAERMRLEREIDAIGHSVREGESSVAEALAADDSARAEELALWVAEKEAQAGSLRESAERLRREEGALTNQLRESIHQLQGYQRELRLARARQYADRAGERLAPGCASLPPGDAIEASLERIRGRQRRHDELLEARRQVADSLKSGLERVREERSAKARSRAAEAVLTRVRLKGAPVRPEP